MLNLGCSCNLEKQIDFELPLCEIHNSEICKVSFTGD